MAWTSKHEQTFWRLLAAKDQLTLNYTTRGVRPSRRRLQNREEKAAKQCQLTQQATDNTTHALDVCGRICTSDSYVDDLKHSKKQDKKQFEEALVAQLKHWKTSCKGGVPKELFYLSWGGKKLCIDDLEKNLRTIIQLIVNKEENVASSSPTQPLQNKDQLRDELKKTLLAKISPTKRRRKDRPVPCRKDCKETYLSLFQRSPE